MKLIFNILASLAISVMSSPALKKNIRDPASGELVPNPAFYAATGQAMPGKDAIPIVSNIEELDEINVERNDINLPNLELAETTETALEYGFSNDAAAAMIGLSKDKALEQVQQLLAQYEIPLGLITKLLQLQKYQTLHFIIDDSGSMRALSDVRDPDNDQVWMTRWEEAFSRMRVLTEIIAYVPTQTVMISFLNRGQGPNEKPFSIVRNGETPATFIKQVHGFLKEMQEIPPTALTPAKASIQKALAMKGSKAIYFFGDGVPSDDYHPFNAIKEMVIKRNDPHLSPITFMSCTNQDADVEWMKNLEEEAPFTSEYDDFNDEKEEVARDQGTALPYNEGFHLVGLLVGAMNPDDLDALDESVPLTKFTLDQQILGYVSSPALYARYFESFCDAQIKRKDSEDDSAEEKSKNQKKRSMQWRRYKGQFETAAVASALQCVYDFKISIGIKDVVLNRNAFGGYPPQQAGQYGSQQYVSPPQVYNPGS